MDSHEMQSHRYQIPYLEIKSDENFEEQTRRSAAFFLVQQKLQAVLQWQAK
jgi:hypothetical protein